MLTRACAVLAGIVVVVSFPPGAIAGGKGAGKTVAVLAGVTGTDPQFKPLAEVAIEIRRALLAKGRKLADPVAALQSKGLTPPDVMLDAEKKFKMAVSSYDMLEFDKAQKGFEAARGLMREVIRTGGTADRYLLTMHYLAATLFYQGKKQAAMRVYADTEVYAPGSKPDGGVFPPDVLEVHEAALKEPAGKGALHVECTPAAEVLVDGKTVGVTPVKVDAVVAGTRLVEFRSPGYEPGRQWVPVADGQTAEARMELREVADLPTLRERLTGAAKELSRGKPGDAVDKLAAQVTADTVVLVVAHKKAVRAGWADGRFWVKQYRATVKPGKMAAYAEAFLASGPVVVKRTGCTASSQCKKGKLCRKGRCVAAAVSTPVYKKWWFWTIVGAAVVGGATAGIVVGTRPDTYRAEAVPVTRP